MKILFKNGKEITITKDAEQRLIESIENLATMFVSGSHIDDFFIFYHKDSNLMIRYSEIAAIYNI